MPVHCPIEIKQLTTKEFGSLDYLVMRHIFASQNEVGRLADEKIYKVDVSDRLDMVHLPSQLEVPVHLDHKTFSKTLYLDLVVASKALYELKTVATLADCHVAQLLTYLNLLDLPHGKLVNFRSHTVESRFVNATIPREERCGFLVSEENYEGNGSFRTIVVDLIRDWGTSLSVTLYHQAIVHFLGGTHIVERSIPLTRTGQRLGNQTFHLVTEDTAFQLTALPTVENDFEAQLRQLTKLSPLRAMHWINIGPHMVTFTTIHNQ